MKNLGVLFVIILIILFAGLLGGLGNYCLIKNDLSSFKEGLYLNDFDLIRSLVLGVIASAIIPLFLNIISSDLLEINERKDNYRNYLIFTSLCLMASLFSSRFLPNAYESAFQQFEAKVNQQFEDRVNVVTKIATEAKKNADAALETEILKQENEVSTSTLNNELETLTEAHNLNINESQLMQKIFKDNRIIYKRNVTGLATNSENIIDTLAARGLIEELLIGQDTIIHLR